MHFKAANKVIATLLSVCLMLQMGMPVVYAQGGNLIEGTNPVPQMVDSGNPGMGEGTPAETISIYAWCIPTEFLNSGEIPIIQQDDRYLLDLSKTVRETSFTTDELIALLPSEILLTVGEDRSEKAAAVRWTCNNYVQDEDGNWPSFGEYIFTGTLPEGFALAEKAAPIEITVVLGAAVKMLTTMASSAAELNTALYTANSEIKPDAAYRGSFVVDKAFGGISVPNIIAAGGNAIQMFSANIPVPDDAWYDFSFEEFISEGSGQVAYGGYFVNAPADGWQKFWCNYGEASIDLSQYTYKRIDAERSGNGGTTYSPAALKVKGGSVLLPYIMQPDVTGEQNSGDFNKFKIKGVKLIKLRNQFTVVTNTGTGTGKVDVTVAGEDSLNKTNVESYSANAGRGATVTLTARPAAGSHFDHWVGADGSDLGKSSTITVTTAADSADETAKSYKAVFTSGEDSRVGAIKDDNSRNDLSSDDMQVAQIGVSWQERSEFGGLYACVDDFYHKLGSSDAKLTIEINVKNPDSTLYGLLTADRLDSANSAKQNVPFKITVDGKPTTVILQQGKSHTAFHINALSAGRHTVTFEPTAKDAGAFLRKVGVVSGSNRNVTLKAADLTKITGCSSYSILVDGEDVTENIKSATGVTAPYGSVMELKAVNADATRYTFQKWDTGAYSTTQMLNIPDTEAAINKAILIARGDVTVTPVYNAGLDINSAILQTPGEKDPTGKDYAWRVNNSSKFSIDADGYVVIKGGGELTLDLTIPTGKAYLPHFLGQENPRFKLLKSNGDVLKEQQALENKDSILVLTEGSYKLVFSNPANNDRDIVRLKNFSCPEYGKLETGRLNITADQTNLGGAVSDATSLVKDAVIAPDYIFLAFMGNKINLIYVPKSHTQKVIGQSYLNDPIQRISLDKVALLKKDMSPQNVTDIKGNSHNFTESGDKLVFDISSDFYETDKGFEIKLHMKDMIGYPYMVGKDLYANGRALYVDSANKVWFYEGNTKGAEVLNLQGSNEQITLADGATIYGGSNKADVESTSLTIDSASGGTTGLKIIGGGNDYGVTGETKVVCHSRKVVSILGGNAGAGTKPNSIMVNIASSTGALETTGGVCGGDATGNVTVQTSIGINGSVTGGSSEKGRVSLVLGSPVSGSVTGVPANGSAKNVSIIVKNNTKNIVGADTGSIVTENVLIKLVDNGCTSGNLYGAHGAKAIGGINIDYLGKSSDNSTIYGQKDSTVGGNVTVNFTPSIAKELYGSHGGSVGGSVTVEASSGKLISDYADSTRAVSGGLVKGNVSFHLTGEASSSNGKTLYLADNNAQIGGNINLRLDSAANTLGIIDTADGVTVAGQSIADIYCNCEGSSIQIGGGSTDSKITLHTVYTQPIYIKAGKPAPALEASLQSQIILKKISSDRAGYDKYKSILTTQPYVDEAAKAIYANGCPVEVKADGIYSNNTSLIGDYSGYTLYGGKEAADVEASSIVVSSVSHPLTIFGAGKNHAVTGTVNLNINTISADTLIYGGPENANMPATSQVNLSINGSSSAAGNIFAGCKNGDFAGKVSLSVHKNLQTTNPSVGNVEWPGAVYVCSENGNFSGEATIEIGAENYLFKVAGGIFDTYKTTGTNSGKFDVQLHTYTNTKIHCPTGSDAQAMNGSVKSASIENGVVVAEPAMIVDYTGESCHVYTNSMPILQEGQHIYIDKGTLGALDEADTLVRGANCYSGKLQIHLGSKDGSAVSSATATIESGDVANELLIEAVKDDVNIILREYNTPPCVLFNKDKQKPQNLRLTLGNPNVWSDSQLNVSSKQFGSYTNVLPLTELTINCQIGSLKADNNSFTKNFNMDGSRYELAFMSDGNTYDVKTQQKAVVEKPVLGTLPADAVAATTPNDGKWAQNAQLTAPTGYLISLAADGDYRPSISYNTSNILPQTVKYYIKGSNSANTGTFNKYAQRDATLRVYSSDAKINENPTEVTNVPGSTSITSRLKLPLKNTDPSACSIGKVYIHAVARTQNNDWLYYNVSRDDVLSGGTEMTRDAQGYWNGTITNLTPMQNYWVFAAYVTESGAICSANDSDSSGMTPKAYPLITNVDASVLTSRAAIEMKEAPTIKVAYGKRLDTATFSGGKVVLSGTDKEIPGKWVPESWNEYPSWGNTGPYTYRFEGNDAQKYAELSKALPIVVTPKPVTAQQGDTPTDTPTIEYGSDGKTTASFIIPAGELVKISDEVKIAVPITLPTDTVGSYIDATSVGEAVKSGAQAAAYVVTLPDYVTGTVIPKNVTRTVSEPHSAKAYYGLGEFSNPEFTGVGNEKISGTFRYTYGGVTNGTFAQVAKEVAKAAVGSTISVDYTFAASGNYSGTITGKVAITMQQPPVKADEDALTIKNSPVYGDSWNDIFKIDNSKVYIMIGITKVSGTCAIQINSNTVSGTQRPNSGSYAYQVLFSSADGIYQNIAVTGLSGTVTVAKKALAESMISITGSYIYTGSKIEPAVTVTDGTPSLIKELDYTSSCGENINAGVNEGSVIITATDNGNYSGIISKKFSIAPKTVSATATAEKVYDGTLNADNAIKFQVSDVLSRDTVILTTNGSTYDNGGTGNSRIVTLGTVIKTGTGSQNYTVTVPATVQNAVISKRPVVVAVDAGQGKCYGQQDSKVLTYTASVAAGTSDSGLVGSEKLSGLLTRSMGEEMGSYTVERGTLTDEANPNYDIQFENANKFVINAANILLNVTLSPTSQKVNKDVIITVTAKNAGEALMNSGWNQPTGISLTGPEGAIALTPVPGNSGAYTGTYRTPHSMPNSVGVTFTASVNDSTGNYTKTGDKAATLTITEKGAVTVMVTPDKETGITYGDNVTYTAEVIKADASDTDALTGTVQFYLDGTGEANKVGSADYTSGKMKMTLNRTKLTAGAHTIYAVYSGNDFFAKSSASTSINVGQKELAWDTSRLAIVKKDDGKTDAAQVQGEIKFTGALEGDKVELAYTGISAAPFTTAEPHSETLTLTVNGANLTGEQAANYRLPSALIITGTINPVEYRPLPDENGMQFRLEIETGISEVPETLKNVGFTTPTKIAQELIRTLTQSSGYSSEHLVVGDITLQTSGNNGLTWQDAIVGNFPDGGLIATLPYPQETGRNTHDFVVTHMFTVAMKGHQPGATEEPTVTKTADGIQFTVTSLSPIGLAWKKVSNSGNASSGGNSYSEDEYDFWNNVEESVENAHSGDIIKVNAYGYDRMPLKVMEALKKHSSVTLVINWNGGKTITIPTGKALKPEAARIYYPLSYLEGCGFGDAAAAIDSSKLNPETGGVLEINAPAVADTATTRDGFTDITDAQRGLAETPELAQQGVEQTIPGVYEPEEAKQSKTNGSVNGALIIAILAMATFAVGGGMWFWKKRNS